MSNSCNTIIVEDFKIPGPHPVAFREQVGATQPHGLFVSCCYDHCLKIGEYTESVMYVKLHLFEYLNLIHFR